MKYNETREETLTAVILSAVVYVSVFDAVFYVGHYLMHWNRKIYRMIHKLHHLSYATVGISANYMHLLDFFGESILPSLVLILLLLPIPPFYPFFYGFSHAGLVGFVTVASFVTVIVHSGWSFSFFPSPTPHYIHHNKQNYNYGSFMVDKIAGTELHSLNSDNQKKFN